MFVNKDVCHHSVSILSDWAGAYCARRHLGAQHQKIESSREKNDQCHHPCRVDSFYTLSTPSAPVEPMAPTLPRGKGKATNTKRLEVIAARQRIQQRDHARLMKRARENPRHAACPTKRCGVCKSDLIHVACPSTDAVVKTRWLAFVRMINRDFGSSKRRAWTRTQWIPTARDATVRKLWGHGSYEGGIDAGRDEARYGINGPFRAEDDMFLKVYDGWTHAERMALAQTFVDAVAKEIRSKDVVAWIWPRAGPFFVPSA